MTDKPEFSFSRAVKLFVLSDLLFEVSSVLLINQHQIKEVAYRELLVDVPHSCCQVISCKETKKLMCRHCRLLTS